MLSWSRQIAVVDWLSFLAAVTKAVSWPIVVIAVIFVLKRNISDLLSSLGGRLEKAKGGGFEFTFGKAIDQVEETLPAAEVNEISEPISPQKVEAVSELAQLPPAYIVSQAWLKLEEAIRDAASIPERSPGIRRAAYRVTDYIELARREGLLQDDEVPAVRQLRELRNQAAHARDPGITVTDALRYLDIVENLIEQIRRRSRKP